MADKTYRLINMPNTTTADYTTCLAAAGGDVVKGLVKLSDEVLLPNAKNEENPTQVEMGICSHLSTLVHEWGASFEVNGTDFEVTVDETIGDEFVTEGYAEEIV
jgi:hypothetical protein